MFKTLSAIFLGRTNHVEQALETANAALIMEQKIQEAEHGHATAKRALASLIARCRSEENALAGLDQRIADLETRTQKALSAGKETLAIDAAKLLAALMNEQAIRCKTRDSAEEKADRLRLAIEKTQRRIIDLRQGLITAKAIEGERQAMKNIRGDLAANAAITEGEAVLQRLLESDDPAAQMDAMEEVEAELSGDAIIDRLANAGFGDATRIRAEDILARFKDRLKPNAGSTAPMNT